MIFLKLRIGLLGRIIIAIAFGILIGSLVPESQNWIVRTFVTFNTIFGQFLGFAIPLIILAFIIPGIGELGKGAGKLVGLTAVIAYARLLCDEQLVPANLVTQHGLCRKPGRSSFEKLHGVRDSTRVRCHDRARPRFRNRNRDCRD